MTFLIYVLYIKGKFYFLEVPDGFSPPNKTPHIPLYYCMDNTLIYTAFFADFGPLDLGLIYRYCQDIEELIRSRTNGLPVIHYCSNHPHKRSNAAVCAIAYLVKIFIFITKFLSIFY